MTDAAAQSVGRPAHVQLRERCARLGLPTWRYSAGGHVIAPPAEQGVVGALLRSRTIELLVERAVQGWVAGQEATLTELFPGCWLIPLPDVHRRRRRAYTVAMALAPEALQSEQFLAACQSASLDAEATRSALRGIAVMDGRTVGRVADLLRWAQEDLQAMARGEHETGLMSRRLGESYEELALLYKLGQSMNQLDHPQRFVRSACAELHEVLAFRWIAARFSGDMRHAGAVAGEFFFHGELPAPVDQCSAEAEKLLRGMLGTDPVILAGEAAGVLGRDSMQVVLLPVFSEGILIGAIMAGQKFGDDPEVTSPDLKMLGAAAGHLSVLLENAALYERQQAMFMGTLEALTASIDAKDPYTCGHSERVAHLASSLALAHGLSAEQAERIRIAGLVHDIGKIGVPESVLCKPGKLTSEEFEQIKLHPEIGHHILRDIPMFDDVLPGVLHHHERFDGTGYPERLAGEAIPLIARIIGLVDAFDAMSSNRTYRRAMDRTQVLEEIRRGAGLQFDPQLAEDFMKVDLSKFDELLARAQQAAERKLNRFSHRPSVLGERAPAGSDAAPGAREEAA